MLSKSSPFTEASGADILYDETAYTFALFAASFVTLKRKTNLFASLESVGAMNETYLPSLPFTTDEDAVALAYSVVNDDVYAAPISLPLSPLSVAGIFTVYLVIPFTPVGEKVHSVPP